MISKPLSTVDLVRLHFSALTPLLDDDTVNDIYVTCWNHVVVNRGGRLHITDVSFDSEYQLEEALRLVAQQQEIKWDQANCYMDTSLPDKSRLSATRPHRSKHLQLTIRPYRRQQLTIDDLLEAKLCPRQFWDWLAAHVYSGSSILVSGATGAGKTTFLRALCTAIPQPQHVITVEDREELFLEAPDFPVVNSFIVPPTYRRTESTEADAMASVITHALSHNPQRLVVGELRTADSVNTLLLALEANLPGVLATIHARSANATFHRLQMLLARLGLFSTLNDYGPMIAFGLDLVVHLELTQHGRRVTGCSRFHDSGATPLYRYDPETDILTEEQKPLDK